MDLKPPSKNCDLFLLKGYLLSKLSEEEFIELNRVLKDLKRILPDTVFTYSEETGIIESMNLKIDNSPAFDINFYWSIPKYASPVNILRKTCSSDVAKSSWNQNKQQNLGR